jgi:hypothetical protein
MPDLNALFQNLGPTGGALMSGLTTGQDLVSSMQQDQMRQAQMDEILQRTAAQRELQPLELQAKQQAVESAKLKAKQEQEAYRDDILSKAIPQLKGLKGPQRMAEMENIFAKAGLPLDEADRQHMYSQDPDKFLSDLEARHKWSVEQKSSYRQAMDVAKEHSRSAENVANINAKSRTEAAAARNAKTASSIEQQASSGKLSYEKAATAFTVMAMNEEDPVKQKQYQDKAAQFEQLAAKLKAAGGVGKVDVGAATNLPTTGYEPVLVPGATPPATPTSPKLPQGWTIK